MSKLTKLQKILLSVWGGLLLCFFLFLGLTLSFGAHGRLIPGIAFAVVGGVIAGLFFASAVLFFLRSRKGS